MSGLVRWSYARSFGGGTIAGQILPGRVASANEAPVCTDFPVLSGTPTEGQTLTVTSGTWTGYPAPTFTYAWCRGIGGNSAPEAFYPGNEGTDWDYIIGETGTSYVLQAADVAEYIFCGVRGTNVEGVYDQSSNNSGLVGAGSADATVVAVAATVLADAPVGGAVVTANANVTAVPATALADAPLGTVSGTAAGTVIAVPATALASAPPANQLISSVVNAPAITILASAPVAVISTVGDVTVTAVPATALADATLGVIQAGGEVTGVPSDATGAAPLGVLSATANVGAVPALALAQAPRPTLSPEPEGGAGTTTLTTTFAEDFA